MAEKREFFANFKYLTPEGESVEVQSRCVKMTDSRNNLVGYYGFVEEIIEDGDG